MKRGVYVGAVLLWAACGGHGGHPSSSAGTGSGAAIAPTDAARWVPPQATYAFVAPNLAVAERGARDLVDGFGIPFLVTSQDVSRDVTRELGIDLFTESAVASIGIDTQASVALFSDAINPTLAVHLADAERFQAFVDERRAAGLHTKSLVVDGTEVFSVGDDGAVSWAVAGEWLLLHITLPDLQDDRKTWFASTRATAASTHGAPADWAWARTAAKVGPDGLVGFADPNAVLGALAAKVADARACVSVFAPVSRIAFGLSGSGKDLSGRIAIDLGPAAARIANAVIAIPPGWEAAGAQAPLAVEWNVDLDAMRRYFRPCTEALDMHFERLDELGIRAARAMLFQFDGDDLTNSSGAAALDLSHQDFFAALVDQIPMRRTLEKRRTFGAYAGANLSIPFVGELDYVLNDHVAMGGVGEGVLARVVGSGPPVKGALARFDIDVEALPATTWAAMIDQLDSRNKRGSSFAAYLTAWRHAHAVLSLAGSELVFEATATRR